MPNEQPTMASPRRMPFGVMGMLAIVVVVEFVIAVNRPNFPEVSRTSWEYSGLRAVERGKDAQVLCFGSSLVKFGVHPSLIEEKTGKPTINLAVYGGGMSASYYLFKKAVDAGARPSAIVLDCHEGPLRRADPPGMGRQIRSNQRSWTKLLTVRECADLAWTARDPQFFASVMVSKLLPSVDSRYEIVGKLMSRWKPDVNPAPDVVVGLVRNWDHNCGSLVMPDPLPPRLDQEPWLKRGTDQISGCDRREWKRNQLLDVYTRRLLDLAAARKMTVFWVFPPLTSGLQHSQDISGESDFDTKFAAQQQVRYPNVVVVDARRSLFPQRVFVDEKHLCMTGEVAFSEGLAEVMSRHLKATNPDVRWYPLPEYRDHPLDRTLENLADSVKAVRAENATRLR